ncbi:arginine--tRNA ligase [Faecalibaculum rodentium]|jgi:arginyl-tRNA synthetase|uniref:Arginine--tRNA ligase n=1 Tax=Faecalibaculum rodentium TaxID=1702221 RepID=A0A1Q9YN59_9FIRM|nr:arginine--tRNA ligase [Faecalibaculum rodentium]OLU47149.1 arginine--tRNA ligase [Faecalibaculum rodentium]
MESADTKLRNAVSEALKQAFDLDKPADEIVIETPRSREHGDFAANTAMQLARVLHRNPRQIAEALAQAVDREKYGIQSVEVAGPGFLNFTMAQDSFAAAVGQILREKSDYGNGAPNGIRVNLEYVSANPTGSLHLGHARGAAWGDSVSRIMKKAGYDVTREYYVNDAGNQIANLARSLQARYRQALGLEAEIGEDGYLGEDIRLKGKELADAYGDVYIEETPENLDFFRREGISFELDKIRRDLNDYRVGFDVWSSEQTIRDAGLVDNVLARLKETDQSYEQDGATWFASTRYGDDKDRVLRKQDGSLTYLVPDLAYHDTKYGREYDEIIDFFGADHHGYVTRLKAGMQALGNDPEKLHVDIIQMVRLVNDGEEMKMSKRLGNATTIRELCERVGVDAARYFFVQRALDSHLDFDMELAARKSNENPVYYAQYAHARMCSIAKGARGLEPAEDVTGLEHEKELALMKVLTEFPKVVQDAARTRQVHKIVHYIQNLASHFHSFYNACKVIDPDAPELSAKRLALVNAARIVLAEALTLIGVNAPETM